MELDLDYVEKKSLFLDLQIIVFTIPAVLVQVWDIKIRREAAAKAVPVKSPGLAPACLMAAGWNWPFRTIARTHRQYE